MSREEFLYYLQNPNNLQDLGYETINQLIAQHPYCQNLRFLLAKKSQLDNAPDYEQNLRRVATYVPVDRICIGVSITALIWFRFNQPWTMIKMKMRLNLSK